MKTFQSALLVILVGAVSGFISPLAAAQTADPAASAPPSQAKKKVATEEDLEEVVITGSILRRTDVETASPVTVLSKEDLELRGINTVAEAAQRLNANNAGTIQKGWNTGFNFAEGALAPALRGLTVQATLSISDGLRMAPYPASDDGQRNFVDLSSIPDAIIERIEVLRDGASSTYGADAIAGVINVITKKEIQGLIIGGSAGFAEQGGAGEKRADITWGIGDLETDGFNFYASAEYQKEEALFARDRGYPFNSSNLTGICNETGTSCMFNGNWNGYTPEIDYFYGLFSVPGVTLVRPISSSNTLANPSGSGRFTYLNPSAGCLDFPVNTKTPGSTTAPSTGVCEVDYQKIYQMLQPESDRRGLSVRFTGRVGESAEVYFIGNYYETTTLATFGPSGFNGTPTSPTSGALSYNVALPVYTCSTGKGTLDGLNTGCTAANGVLNPYNPFASQGLRAQALLRSPYGRTSNPNNRTLRAVLGVKGEFGDDWRYSVDATSSESRLIRLQQGYLIPQRIMDVVARGTFNFSNPTATPEAVWDYISPDNRTTAFSNMNQIQATIGKDLIDLAGGPLQAAVGVSYRTEGIDYPSANKQNDSAPYTRYYSINSVGTYGKREVESGFFEVDAPLSKFLMLSGSGRYDNYSSGQSNFSPKLGVKIKPVERLLVRGTWTEGFRIPSFNEAYGLPTTGYVSRFVNCSLYAAFCNSHGGASQAYVKGAYSLGLTQTGNPDVQPENSESVTAGVVWQPLDGLVVSLDYWRIKIKGLISGVTDTSPVEAAYYSNNGVVNIPGFNAVPGAPDPAYPNALPLLAFIESSYVNQDAQIASGVDIGVDATFPVGNYVIRSGFDASYLDQFDLKTDTGDTLKYAGTLSPCAVTSCSGAPQWRASWQNTIQRGNTSVTLTAYYTSGYDLASVDSGGVKGDCEGSIGNSVITFEDGSPVLCKANAQWNADLSIRHKLNEQYTIYANVMNVLDIAPELDPSAAYHIFQFNPAWAGPNIMGRYLRVGFKAEF